MTHDQGPESSDHVQSTESLRWSRVPAPQQVVKKESGWEMKRKTHEFRTWLTKVRIGMKVVCPRLLASCRRNVVEAATGELYVSYSST